jgi:hypothetical protein
MNLALPANPHIDAAISLLALPFIPNGMKLIDKQ